MTKYINVTETAKIIRKILKKEFPHTKFSVRSSKYSGGSSIRIGWEDGAAYTKVDEAIEQFRGKSFDGMSDVTKYHKTEWQDEDVCFAHYISLYRDTSREFVERVYAYCQESLACANKLKIVGSKINSRFDVDSYSEFQDVMCKANTILNESDSDHGSASYADRVFNWEQEKAENELEEERKQQLIDDQKVADKQYLESLETPQEYQEYFGQYFGENNQYFVLGATAHFVSDYYLYIDSKLKLGSHPNYYDVPDNKDREINWKSRVNNKENGEFLEWAFDSVVNAIDPIVPISITPVDFRIKGKFASLNKNNKLDHYKEYCSLPEYSDGNQDCSNWYLEDCQVIENIELSPEHYDRFTEQLLDDFDWIKGKGGTNSDAEGLPQDKEVYAYSDREFEFWRSESYSICFAITAKGRETILVNPEGHSYARYVALVDKEVIEWALDDEIEKSKPEQQVIDFAEYKQDKQDKQIDNAKIELEGLYKTWLQKLIDSDLLSEIINYQAWLGTYGQVVLEKQYKKFVNNCIAQGLLEQIVSFEQWQQNN